MRSFRVNIDKRCGLRASTVIRLAIIVLSAWLSILPGTPVMAQGAVQAAVPAEAPHVIGRLIADQTAVEAGKPFRLGVELTMQPNWHTYYREPGDAGMATRIQWQLPPGFSVSSLKWQRPHRFDDAGITTFGYADKTLIAATVTPPKALAGGAKLKFGAKVKWLSCREVCIPGGQDVSLTLPTVAPGKAAQDNTAQFATANFDGPSSEIKATDEKQSGSEQTGSILDQNFKASNSSESSLDLIAYLGFAWLGGLILNCMPCVLPVVAIKVLGWLEQAESSPMAVRICGAYYTAGVTLSFLTLAGIIIAAREAGEKIGWGFQFQYPPFLILMCAIVLLFAHSLFGMFHINPVGHGAIGDLAEKDNALGTFSKGVLATILSTPCTAPFLGPALGFAFIQPWWVVLSIFFMVGLGMSTPYFLLMINPKLLKRLPKPGAWMEKLKEFMGFILLGTVVWLMSVLGSEVGVDAMISVWFFLVALSFATWIVSRFGDLTQSNRRRYIVKAIAITIAIAAAQYFIGSKACLLHVVTCESVAKAQTPEADANSPIAWQPFDLDELDKDIKSGKTVFLDFTAQWCLTCKANETAVLNSQSVVDKLKALNVVPMRADWTTQNETITKLLRKFNRSGVPLYVIFPANNADAPIVLPEVITPGIVLEKLTQAGPSRS
jgi:thiol:disulfide interchange protein